MVTLLIEHRITDYATWRAAFDGFAEHRRASGVHAERVGQPVGDRQAILVELDFGTETEAAAFLAFLETVVWASSETAPALAGRPRTVILESMTV